MDIEMSAGDISRINILKATAAAPIVLKSSPLDMIVLNKIGKSLLAYFSFSEWAALCYFLPLF